MASTLISVADVVNHLETSLGATDPELERLVDSADAMIRSVYGSHVDGERTIRLTITPGHKFFLPYPAAESVAEIKEYSEYELSSEAVEVPTTEYELEQGGVIVIRPKKYFKRKVIVRYTPVDDSAERVHILIDLVRLADQYEAVKLEELGAGRGSGVSTEYLDYTKEQGLILNRMRSFTPGQFFV